MFKMAGAQTALTDLGLEKEAFLGTLARGALSLGGRAIGALSSPLAGAANKGLNWAGKTFNLSQKTVGGLRTFGKEMARDAVGGGLFEGGLNAALAEPGDRGSAFMRGMGSGMIGGALFRGGMNATTMGMKRMMPKSYGKYEQMAKPGFFGKLAPGESRLKSMGAKTLIGGVPFAAGMGASFLTPNLHGSEHQTPAQQMTPYASRLGVGAASTANLFPARPRFNPNLPLPQGRF
jgi:hypothetical protein